MSALRIPNQAHLKIKESKLIQLMEMGNLLHLHQSVAPRWKAFSTDGTMSMQILSIISPSTSARCQLPTLRIDSGGPG